VHLVVNGVTYLHEWVLAYCIMNESDLLFKAYNALYLSNTCIFFCFESSSMHLHLFCMWIPLTWNFTKCLQICFRYRKMFGFGPQWTVALCR